MKDDELWQQDKIENGWALPKPAHWLFRLPVVRRVRYALVMDKLRRHASAWGPVGIGINQYDLWVAYAIARGWC